MANELKFGNKVVFLGGNPITLPQRASDPGSAVNGDMYYNTVSDSIKIYQAGSWQNLATGTAAANTSLSNLTTTSINQDLLPDANNTRSLGSASLIWSTLWSDSLAYPSGPSISLSAGRQVDSSGNTSVHWANRTLNSDTATVQLAWSSSGVAFSQLTASTVPYLNASKILTSSSVTPTELGYLSGVTSAIQTQLNAKANDNIVIKKDGSVAFLADQSMGGFKLTNLADGTLAGDAVNKGQLDLYIPLSQKGANNGVATLDGGGKIPVAQLPSSVMTYEGTWNANTNTPTLADGVGDAGMVYLTTVAGTVDFGSGPITFAVGDWAVYNGSIWEKSTNSNAVVSVNGQTGVVVLDTGDISEGSNLYFTDERAQDAVGGILASSTNIEFTYDDGTPEITASVIAGSLTNAEINAAAAIALTKLAATTANRALASDGSGFIVASSVTDTELGYLSGVTSAIQTQLNGKANLALSNLASVAINTSLISDTDNTDDLGSDAIEWKDVWAHNVKHNSAGTPNLGIMTTGNNGSIIMTAHGTGNLDILATKIRRAENGAGSVYMEDQYFDSLTLAANTSAAAEISSSLSFALASFDGAVINYRIKEDATSKTRIGQLIVSCDGTIASSSDQFSETAALGSALGLSLSADVSGGNVRILYNNTHASNNAVMRCHIRRFRA